MIRRASCVHSLVQSLRVTSLSQALAHNLGSCIWYASQAASSLQQVSKPLAYEWRSGEYADIDWDNLGFGIIPADYMYTTKCSKDGVFEQGQLTPYKNLELSPSAGVLNYGQGLYEGTKAYRTEDGRLLLFSPYQNAMRMRMGADRMCMPCPSIDQFVDGVKQIAFANKQWQKEVYILDLCLWGVALYWVWLRHLNIHSLYMLVLLETISRWIQEGLAPLNLFIEEEFHRASRGGAGGVKSITNYAPVLKAIARAKSRGFSDVLYLDSVHKKYLEEVSSCNIFLVKGNVISTPAANGTILQGVTRRSIIEIARDQGYQVEEGAMPVEELMEADEVFCTGTAVGVAPVGSITYQNTRVEYKMKSESVSQQLYSILEGIKRGVIDDKKGWIIKI